MAVLGVEASTTWLVVSAHRVCRRLFKISITKAGKCVSFFSEMKVHCDVMWFLEMDFLQNAASSMADRASRLATSENSASEHAGDY